MQLAAIARSRHRSGAYILAASLLRGRRHLEVLRQDVPRLDVGRRHADDQDHARLSASAHRGRADRLRPAARDAAPDQRQVDAHVRVTNLVLPNAFMIPMSQEMTISQWHVPIDETTHYWYCIFTELRRKVDKDEMRRQRLSFTSCRITCRARTSTTITASIRTSRRTRPLRGMGADINVHDQWACESMGPVQDRTEEHLGQSDKAITAYRRMLRAAIEQASKRRADADGAGSEQGARHHRSGLRRWRRARRRLAGLLRVARTSIAASTRAGRTGTKLLCRACRRPREEVGASMSSRDHRARCSFVERHGSVERRAASRRRARDREAARYARSGALRRSPTSMASARQDAWCAAGRKVDAKRRVDDDDAAVQGHVAPHGVSGVHAGRRLCDAGDAGRRRLPDDRRSHNLPVLPWAPNTGWVLCDIYFQNGKPVPFSTRQLCRNALTLPARQGYRLVGGPRSRISSLPDRKSAPCSDRCDMAGRADRGRAICIRVSASDRSAVRSDRADAGAVLARAPWRSGCRSSRWRSSSGRASASSPSARRLASAAADMMVLFRSAMKQIARRHGLHCTFMCRPGLPNAFFVRLASASVADRCEDRAPMRSSRTTAESAVAARPALARRPARAMPRASVRLFTTPTVNGYKRYRAYALAPDRVIWGQDNRGVMVRVIGAPGDPGAPWRTASASRRPTPISTSPRRSRPASMASRAISTPPPSADTPYESRRRDDAEESRRSAGCAARPMPVSAAPSATASWITFCASRMPRLRAIALKNDADAPGGHALGAEGVFRSVLNSAVLFSGSRSLSSQAVRSAKKHRQFRLYPLLREMFFLPAIEACRSKRERRQHWHYHHHLNISMVGRLRGSRCLSKSVCWRAAWKSVTRDNGVAVVIFARAERVGGLLIRYRTRPSRSAAVVDISRNLFNCFAVQPARRSLHHLSAIMTGGPATHRAGQADARCSRRRDCRSDAGPASARSFDFPQKQTTCPASCSR